MTFSAVLLAGGESRRMGTDKATFLFRGKPLWRIQLETLQKMRPKEILVSARTDPEWRPNDIKFVADISPSRGPLSGLAASLERIRTTHLLVLAIDMPCMSNEYLEFLSTQIKPGRGVLPKIGDRSEPVAAIYPREARVDFQSALAGMDFSLQNLVRLLLENGKLRELHVKMQDAKLFLNVNTMAELQSG